MKKKTVSLLALVVSAMLAYGQTAISPIFSRNELQQDLIILQQAIQEAHPGYGRFTDSGLFDQEFDKIYKALPEKTTLAHFFRKTNALVAQVNCGHTKYHPDLSGIRNYPFYFNPANVFPLLVIIRYDKLFVLKAPPAVSIPAGSEITKINGTSAMQILGVLRKNQFADGNVESSKNRAIEENFASCYANFIGNPDQFVIEYRIDDKSDQITAKGISVRQWDALKKETPGFLASTNNLRYQDDSTAVLRMADFHSSRKKIAAFIRRSFKAINKRNVNHLIIDLRGNQGGFDRLGAILYRHLANQRFQYYDRIEVKANSPKQFSFREHASFNKLSGVFKFFTKKEDSGYRWMRHYNLRLLTPAKYAYQKKVYFLMDGATYSVSAEFLAMARSQNRGLFIGEEAGGAYNGNNSGTFAFITLPNTRMMLAIPLGGYYMRVSDQFPSAKGVEPDISIEPDIKDILNKTDPVLQRTYELIKTR